VRLRVTPAQLALAWLLARKPWIVPIPGTRRASHLDENVAAASVALTRADLDDIDAAASSVTVQGARLPELFESLSGR
jgi:aryl-alcohol dehydrogenase-like predicted oxidoreductase